MVDGTGVLEGLEWPYSVTLFVTTKVYFFLKEASSH